MANPMIRVETYEELNEYVDAYARGDIKMLMLIGDPGTGKSQAVKRRLAGRPHTVIDTYTTPRGIYDEMYQFAHDPIVFDDLGSLLKGPQMVSLFKCACNTDKVRVMRWVKSAKSQSETEAPPMYTMTSPICILANEWENLNTDVRAMTDRAIVVQFCPTAEELHRKVATYFGDQEVFDFVGQHIHLAPAPSMRFYIKALQLKRAQPFVWRDKTRRMMLPWHQADLAILELRSSPMFTSENQRAKEFEAMGHGDRSTYYRRKKALPDIAPVTRRVCQGSELTLWSRDDQEQQQADAPQALAA